MQTISNFQTYLLLGHPCISLLGVSVEELQVHALLVQDATLLPQLVQACLLISQGHQLQKVSTKLVQRMLE